MDESDGSVRDTLDERVVIVVDRYTVEKFFDDVKPYVKDILFWENDIMTTINQIHTDTLKRKATVLPGGEIQVYTIQSRRDRQFGLGVVATDPLDVVLRRLANGNP